MPKPNPSQPEGKPSAAASEPPSPQAAQETKRTTDSVPVATGTFAKLPAKFGRYQVEKLLGRGAMGAVYLARDTQLERPVALKIPRVSGSGAARLLARLKTEAKAAARIDHPNVCHVHDAGEIDGVPFIVMQYVEGETLKEHLAKQSLPPAAAVTFVIHLAEGLAEAHAQGIYHRDLKPENIKLNRRGVPVIMDFGLAKLAATITADAGATQKGTILGSPAYMSPEQAGGKVEDVDHRSDIYALGVILYEMLTGQWPFSGAAIQVMGQKSVLEPASPLTVKTDLNPQLAAVCHKMIAKDRQNRYQSAHEVIAALQEIDLGMPGGSSPAAAPAEPSSTDPIEFPNFLADEESLASRRRPLAKHRAASRAANRSGGPRQSVALWWNRLSAGGKWTSATAGVVLLAGLVLWASGVFTRVKTKDGILVIEVNEPGADVFVDGAQASVTWGEGEKGGRRATVMVQPGEHKIRLTKEGFSVVAKKLVFKEGIREIFKARLEPEAEPAQISVSSEGSAEQLPRSDDETSKASDNSVLDRIREIETRRDAPVKSNAPPDALAFRNKRFFIFTNAKSWHDAKKKSLEMGGRLAEVESQEENDFLATLGRARNVEGIWLGATDEAQEGQWRWTDGSPVTYSDWSRAGNQPNNKGGLEHYLMLLTKNGEWCDQPATSLEFKKTGYVCEWNAEPGDSRLSTAAPAAANEPDEKPAAGGKTVRDARPGESLDKAQAAYDAGWKRFQEAVLDSLKKREEAARKGGKKDLVDQIQAERKAFERDRELPQTFPTAFHRRLVTAQKSLETAYAAAIKEMTRAGLDADAARAHRELERFREQSELASAWVPLFNGRNLSGWKRHPEDKSTWSAEGGVLVGGGGHGYLYTERGNFSNFRLRVEAQISDKGNSGVFLRSPFGPGIPDGYEPNIDGAGLHTGTMIVYRQQKIVQSERSVASPARPNDWFTMDILARGETITVLIDGKQAVRFHDPQKSYTSGHIVLQVMAGTVRFRKVEISEFGVRR